MKAFLTIFLIIQVSKYCLAAPTTFKEIPTTSETQVALYSGNSLENSFLSVLINMRNHPPNFMDITTIKTFTTWYKDTVTPILVSMEMKLDHPNFHYDESHCPRSSLQNIRNILYDIQDLVEKGWMMIRLPNIISHPDENIRSLLLKTRRDWLIVYLQYRIQMVMVGVKELYVILWQNQPISNVVLSHYIAAVSHDIEFIKFYEKLFELSVSGVNAETTIYENFVQLLKKSSVSVHEIYEFITHNYDYISYEAGWMAVSSESMENLIPSSTSQKLPEPYSPLNKPMLKDKRKMYIDISKKVRRFSLEQTLEWLSDLPLEELTVSLNEKVIPIMDDIGILMESYPQITDGVIFKTWKVAMTALDGIAKLLDMLPPEVFNFTNNPTVRDQRLIILTFCVSYYSLKLKQSYETRKISITKDLVKEFIGINLNTVKLLRKFQAKILMLNSGKPAHVLMIENIPERLLVSRQDMEEVLSASKMFLEIMKEDQEVSEDNSNRKAQSISSSRGIMFQDLSQNCETLINKHHYLDPDRHEHTFGCETEGQNFDSTSNLEELCTSASSSRHNPLPNQELQN